MHPKAKRNVRRSLYSRIAANRRKYLKAADDCGVSPLEQQVLQQMKAEEAQKKKPVITI